MNDIDLMERERRREENRRAHAEQQAQRERERTGNSYTISDDARARARSALRAKRSRRLMRDAAREIALAATYDENTTTRDALIAAAYLGKVSGDVRERVDVNVRHSLSLKSLRQRLDGDVASQRAALEVRVAASRVTPHDEPKGDAKGDATS